MLVHALRAIGADPAFLLGGELPGAGPGRRAGERRLGRRASGSSPRPTSPTRSFLRAAPRGRRGHQRRARPPLALASRAELLEAFRRFCEPAARPGAPGRRRGLDALAGGAARSCASTPTGPGPRARPRGPRRHNLAQRPRRRSPPPSSRASTLAARGGRARRVPGHAAPPRAARAHRERRAVYDDYAHHPTEVAAALAALRELEPAPADRRLPAPPLLAHQGARRALRRAPSRPPTRSGCSTSTRRARSRSASSPGSAASTSRGRRPTAPAAGRSGGCVDAETAPSGPSPRGSREGDLLVTIGAGDIFSARRRAGRRTSGAVSEPARRGRARLPARAADHRSRRRPRRPLRPPGDRGALVELLALGAPPRASR